MQLWIHCLRFALSRLFVGGEEELTTSESCLLKKSFILKFAIFIAGDNSGASRGDKALKRNHF